MRLKYFLAVLFMAYIVSYCFSSKAILFFILFVSGSLVFDFVAVAVGQ